jgi:hypothetical protein
MLHIDAYVAVCTWEYTGLHVFIMYAFICTFMMYRQKLRSKKRLGFKEKYMVFYYGEYVIGLVK